MYPRISDLTQDLFGFESPIDLFSFGLMVAIAILVATTITRLEVDRRYALGWMKAVRAKVRDAKGREKVELTSPSALLWNMALLAAIFGVAGSKLFYIIDNWGTFVQDPMGMIFSGSGLTIYGGILCASLAILVYANRKGIHKRHLADAVAPGLMMGYGIGRIGCYLSGDGDWGVCSSLADKPAWLPGWLWSETFPNNWMNQIDPVVFNEEVRGVVCEIADPDGVYPTMLYEFAMAAVLAGVLWALRKNPFQAGWLISLYGVFAGAERFLIEQIRVNPEFAFGLSQSELISIGFIAAGLVGLALTTKRRADAGTPAAAPAARA